MILLTKQKILSVFTKCIQILNLYNLNEISRKGYWQ
nr:MAG TPA: hypothetical protein [Caudoviricetes sp.]